MVVSILYHDLDNGIHDHSIGPLVENIHPYKDRIVVESMGTWAFHGENMPVMVMVVTNTVNET